jgi:carbohydrate-binding DOMON domain-containing protein
MKLRWKAVLMASLIVAMSAGTALAQGVSFKDPTGDDNGPGNYVYPTDAVYKRGSFDLTGLDVTPKGKNVDFKVSVASSLEDPWSMGGGFAVQMAFIFIDYKEGGYTDTLPGLNVQFAEDSAWDKVVILSPQQPGRVKNEVDTKAAAMAKDIVIPTRTRGSGRAITGTVDLAALGIDAAALATAGYQVVMQSNEGFPSGSDLLTRKVNEFEGQHRFGGGNDMDCDPHVMDILAGSGSGDDSEKQAQYDMLKHECGDDGSSVSMATLKMVRK